MNYLKYLCQIEKGLLYKEMREECQKKEPQKEGFLTDCDQWVGYRCDMQTLKFNTEDAKEICWSRACDST